MGHLVAISPESPVMPVQGGLDGGEGQSGVHVRTDPDAASRQVGACL